MKNIIAILLIFIIPVAAYFFIKETPDGSAIAQDNNKPTLITYTSTMCADCKKLKEVLKEVEPEYSDRVNFVKINALENNKKVQDSLKQYNVVLVPTMIFLDKEGNTKNKTEGFIPKEQLKSELEGLING